MTFSNREMKPVLRLNSSREHKKNRFVYSLTISVICLAVLLRREMTPAEKKLWV